MDPSVKGVSVTSRGSMLVDYAVGEVAVVVAVVVKDIVSAMDVGVGDWVEVDIRDKLVWRVEVEVVLDTAVIDFFLDEDEDTMSLMQVLVDDRVEVRSEDETWIGELDRMFVEQVSRMAVVVLLQLLQRRRRKVGLDASAWTVGEVWLGLEA